MIHSCSNLSSPPTQQLNSPCSGFCPSSSLKGHQQLTSPERRGDILGVPSSVTLSAFDPTHSSSFPLPGTLASRHYGPCPPPASFTVLSASRAGSSARSRPCGFLGHSPLRRCQPPVRLRLSLPHHDRARGLSPELQLGASSPWLKFMAMNSSRLNPGREPCPRLWHAPLMSPVCPVP